MANQEKKRVFRSDRRIFGFFDDDAKNYTKKESLFLTPKTTRVYLQPAMSERLFTLWRGGKLLFSEVLPKYREEYFDIFSAGILFVHGENHEISDHTEASYISREDSVPVFGLKNNYGPLEVTIEAFGSEGLKSSLYAKITLKNPSDVSVCHRFGFATRCAEEWMLVRGAPDLYCSYRENPEEWFGDLLPTFESKDGLLTDGEYTLSVKGVNLEYDEKCGVSSKLFELSAGEEVSFTLSMDMGEVKDFDYEAEKTKVIAYWNGEIAKMTRIPKGIKDNEAFLSTVKSLGVSILQCLCKPKGTDMTFCRQGCLQRCIWIYEAMYALEGLELLGDFSDYVEEVLSLYFDKCMEESGEVITLGIPWAMATGQAIMTFANHVMLNENADYSRFADKAYKAFLWMKKTRASSEDTENTVKGLFPPLPSCDCQLVFQAWLTTDTNNLLALERYVRAAKKYADPHYEEIKAEYDDYLAVMQYHYDKAKNNSDKSDEIDIPLAPAGNIAEIEKQFSFGGAWAFLVGALVPPTEEIEKILLCQGKKKGMHDNLYDRMPGKTMKDPDGVSRVWYIVAHEYHIFMALLKNGDKKRAGELLSSMLKYGITEENYSMERVHERDPYFAPWMPNASNSGRLISAIFDFYGN